MQHQGLENGRWAQLTFPKQMANIDSETSRIYRALVAGKSKAKRSAVNRQVPMSLDDAIAPNIVCSQDLRAFFEQYLGKGFRFKVEFQSWLRENAGLTFRDAVETYPTLVKSNHR